MIIDYVRTPYVALSEATVFRYNPLYYALYRLRPSLSPHVVETVSIDMSLIVFQSDTTFILLSLYNTEERRRH